MDLSFQLSLFVFFFFSVIYDWFFPPSFRKHKYVMRSWFLKSALLICVEWESCLVSLFFLYYSSISLLSHGQGAFSSLPQAFDQQQQDLIDAASKALSYRQDIIEENIRLTYALQVLFLSDVRIFMAFHSTDEISVI